MTPCLTSWPDLLARSGNLLAIVNVSEHDQPVAERFFDRLGSRVELASFYVLAEMSWLPWLDSRGVPPERVLIAEDVLGQPLELNHFLESPDSLQWILSKPFDTILGVSPHPRENEYVQLPFEERLCLFIGRSRFVAHTLPHEYLYVFDLPMLLRRRGRARKTAEYTSACRAMVSDWHARWIGEGRPTDADDGDGASMMSTMNRHWPHVTSTGEEQSIASESTDPLELALPSVEYLRRVIADRDQRIDSLHLKFDHLFQQYQERLEAVETREVLLAEKEAERVHAVKVRDEIIDDLRRRQLKERLRRLFGQGRS